MAYKKICGIYAIILTATGQQYVGSAASIKARWDNHRRRLNDGKHHSIHLQRAWNLYGAAAFEFRILEECAVEQLLEREQHHMDADPMPRSRRFNMYPAARSPRGHRQSAEHRRKTSRIQKQVWENDEHREEMRETHRVNAAKDYENFRSRFDTPEVLEKQRQKAQQRMTDPQKRERLIKQGAEAVAKPKVRAAISDSVRNLWDDPVYVMQQMTSRGAGWDAARLAEYMAARERKRLLKLRRAA